MDRTHAFGLVTEYVKGPGLQRHMLATQEITMSITQSNVFQNGQEVIARAFGDEPLKLISKQVFEGLVELDAEGSPALFLEKDVFPFNSDLFKKLRKAFDLGDKMALSKFWSDARKVA